MKKELIRLTESDLHDMVKNAVMNILKEGTLDHHDPEYKNGIEDDDAYDGTDPNDGEVERSMRKTENEQKNETRKITESELHGIVKDAVMNILTGNKK